MAIVILSWVGLSFLLCLALLKAAARRTPASEQSLIHRNIPKSQIDSLVAAQNPINHQREKPVLEGSYTAH